MVFPGVNYKSTTTLLLYRKRREPYVDHWKRTSGYKRCRTAIFSKNGAVAIDGTTIKKVGTLEEIKKLHPAASMGPGYNNVKIPTLEETLDTCKGRIKLNIEIKEDGTESSDFTERVIQLIRDKGMTDQCMITSFCYTVLEKVKAIEPSLKTGYIRSKDIEDFSQYPAADQYMLSIELIRKDRVDQIHSLGKKVTAWTVNDLYSLRKCESAQVDDMITDDPGGLLKLDDQ